MSFQSRQPHAPFVTRKFYARVIDCSVFVKTTKTAYQLKSNDVTVASINLADELVILLIFVNNKHFVNGKGVTLSHADKMGMQALHEQGLSEQFSKNNNSCV